MISHTSLITSEHPDHPVLKGTRRPGKSGQVARLMLESKPRFQKEIPNEQTFLLRWRADLQRQGNRVSCESFAPRKQSPRGAICSKISPSRRTEKKKRNGEEVEDDVTYLWSVQFSPPRRLPRQRPSTESIPLCLFVLRGKNERFCYSESKLGTDPYI